MLITSVVKKIIYSQTEGVFVHADQLVRGPTVRTLIQKVLYKWTIYLLNPNVLAELN